jgi:hypothetical protein
LSRDIGVPWLGAAEVAQEEGVGVSPGDATAARVWSGWAGLPASEARGQLGTRRRSTLVVVFALLALVAVLLPVREHRYEARKAKARDRGLHAT